MRFPLERVVGGPNLDRWSVKRGSAALLNDVCQLVRQQLTSAVSLRRVVLSTEDDVSTDCIRHGVDRSR